MATDLDKINRLRDWLVNDTLSMSDAEIEAEIRESGEDPKEVAAHTRAVAMRAVEWTAKSSYLPEK